MATRRVISGSFPLYRLVMTALLVSSVLSLSVTDTPDSVQTLAGTASDTLYLVAALVGAVLVLSSLHVRRAWLSLHLERVGAIFVATHSAIYTVAVVYSLGMPTAAATWGSMAVGIYCAWRALVEIPRDLEEVRGLARDQCDHEEAAHG